jgi:hypothetical protein
MIRFARLGVAMRQILTETDQDLRRPVGQFSARSRGVIDGLDQHPLGLERGCLLRDERFDGGDHFAHVIAPIEHAGEGDTFTSRTARLV